MYAGHCLVATDVLSSKYVAVELMYMCVYVVFYTSEPRYHIVCTLLRHASV